MTERDRPHSFHIPVMGTGFTADTPLKVARFGIDSVISLVDDKLLEKLRGHHCAAAGETYEPITARGPEGRIARIREYLSSVGRWIAAQMRVMRSQALGGEGDIDVYFGMLDPESSAARRYDELRSKRDPVARRKLETELRDGMRAGEAQVNIMVKLDREPYDGAGNDGFSDAVTALRGFAESTLMSSLVLSAGYNPRLFAWLEKFPCFSAPKQKDRKKIILKVSDFRSAHVQAKILAKKGIWVHEFRIESGLNCGGHAFAGSGHLMGQVLDEFCRRRTELHAELLAICGQALTKRGVSGAELPPARVTAQGGIGTAAEHRLLMRRYGVDSVGWGTPFLLVPEATAVDEDTLVKLAGAGPQDVRLSEISPLGVPFYTLRDSLSETAKYKRAAEGHPGSPCLNKFIAFNTDFGSPMCVASRQYQERKLRELRAEGLPEESYAKEYASVIEKACICHDLGDGALLKYGIGTGNVPRVPAVCPGPNIAFFSRIVSLREMAAHIYGKRNVIEDPDRRPHAFMNELRLNVDYCRRLIESGAAAVALREFVKNLMDGIAHYEKLCEELIEESQAARRRFASELESMKQELLALAAAVPA